MSTATSIQSSTHTPALAPISVAYDLGLADTGFNNDSETARTHSPSHELNDGKSSPLTPLEEEDPSETTTNVAPLDISQEEYDAGPDEEVEGSDDDPPYSPGDTSSSEDETPPGLLSYAHRRPLGVSTSAISKKDVTDLDRNEGQCLLTRDLATETGVQNAHLVPQAWSSKPELVSELVLRVYIETNYSVAHEVRVGSGSKVQKSAR